MRNKPTTTLLDSGSVAKIIARWIIVCPRRHLPPQVGEDSSPSARHVRQDPWRSERIQLHGGRTTGSGRREGAGQGRGDVRQRRQLPQADQRHHRQADDRTVLLPGQWQLGRQKSPGWQTGVGCRGNRHHPTTAPSCPRFVRSYYRLTSYMYKRRFIRRLIIWNSFLKCSEW